MAERGELEELHLLVVPELLVEQRVLVVLRTLEVWLDLQRLEQLMMHILWELFLEQLEMEAQEEVVEREVRVVVVL